MTNKSTLIAKCGSKTIQSGPYIKPTYLGVPLQDTCCHPAHIHKSWPVSMVRRLGDVSTSHSYAEKAKEILIERFVRHLASPDLINLLRATSTSQTKTTTNTKRLSGDRMWVTFPFHPVWATRCKAIRRFLNDENWSVILSHGFEERQDMIDKIKNTQVSRGTTPCSRMFSRSRSYPGETIVVQETFF